MVNSKKSLRYIFEDRVYNSDAVAKDDYNFVMDKLGNPNHVLPSEHYLTFEIIFKEKYSPDLTVSWIKEYFESLELPFPSHLKPKHWYKHIFPKYNYKKRLEVYKHKLGNPKIDYNILIDSTISEMMEYQEMSINETANGINYYRRKCNFVFNKKDLIKIDGYDILKNKGWFGKNNTLGVTKDHKFSIKSGFENKIPPYIMSHPANCEFMSMRKNSSKSSKNSITLNELKHRIQNWDKY